jgi:hypothetical protein
VRFPLIGIVQSRFLRQHWLDCGQCRGQGDLIRRIFAQWVIVYFG